MMIRTRSSIFVVLQLFLCILTVAAQPQQKLSVHWEELTAADFTEGIQRAQGTCLLPFGILENTAPICLSVPIF
jgi:creatinine amidohydrolase